MAPHARFGVWQALSACPSGAKRPGRRPCGPQTPNRHEVPGGAASRGPQGREGRAQARPWQAFACRTPRPGACPSFAGACAAKRSSGVKYSIAVSVVIHQQRQSVGRIYSCSPIIGMGYAIAAYRRMILAGRYIT